MDILIEDKTSKIGYQKYIIILVISTGIIIGIAWLSISAKETRVKSESLMIAEVEKGDLILEVRGSGSFQPESQHWISAENQATLDKLFIKTGNIVKKEQILMRFSNPDLMKQQKSMEWKIKALRAKKLAKAKSLEMDLAEQQLNYKNSYFDHLNSLQEREIEKILRDRSHPQLTDVEWQNLLAKINQSKEVVRLEKVRLDKIKASLEADVNVIDVELNQCLYELDTINRKIKKLEVKANRNGIVQSLSVEEGQLIQIGTPMVRITSIDDFYVELNISQDQIAQVEPDQKTLIATRHGSVAGFVRHIHGAVQQGTVSVDIELTGELPKGAKEDQRVEGTVTTDFLAAAVFVSRPTHIQANQSGWVFRLNEKGDQAKRIKVRFGKTGVQKIQVLSGLSEGDRIIVSELGNWQLEENILIQ